MAEPLVSVCVPVKNGEKTIARALRSIVEQSYRNIEILVSDNFSSDKTREILKSFQKEDSRVRLFFQEEDIGAFANYEFLRRVATGQFFMLAAHDDTRNSEFIESLVRTLETDDSIALCIPKTETFLDGKLVWRCLPYALGDSSNVLGRYLDVVFRFPAVGMYGLYRKSLLDKTRGWRAQHGGDILLIHELSLYGRFTFDDLAVFSYHEAINWKTLKEEAKMIFPREKGAIKRKGKYGLEMVRSQLEDVLNAPLSSTKRAILAFVPILHFGFRAFKKLALISLRFFVPGRYRTRIGKWLYFKLFHPNFIEVVNQSLFGKRNMNTVMGIKIYE